MTASTGKSDPMSSEINITPMIDVLLVLLIIFMVIAPAMQKGEAVLAPRPGHTDKSVDKALVLEVLKDGDGVAYRLNQTKIGRQELQARLAAIYASRADHELFVKGDDSLSFTEVAEAIDIGHAAGADRIGLVTAQMTQ